MIFHFVSLDINYSFYIAILSYRQIVINSFLYDNDKYLIIILCFLIIIYMYIRTYNQLLHMGLFLYRMYDIHYVSFVILPLSVILDCTYVLYSYMEYTYVFGSSLQCFISYSMSSVGSIATVCIDLTGNMFLLSHFSRCLCYYWVIIGLMRTLGPSSNISTYWAQCTH